MIVAKFDKKPWFITSHSLKRLNERLGDVYWYGRKVKNMSKNQQKRFVLYALNKARKNTSKIDYITFKVETKYFVSIVVPELRFNKIKTLYEPKQKRSFSKNLTSTVGQILKIKNQQLVHELSCN